jgi:hypothetical protein
METLSYLRLIELIMANAQEAAEGGVPTALIAGVVVNVHGERVEICRCFLDETNQIVLSAD